ncbi:MAG: DUF2927 domain-containing protein [Hyphomicrobiales bacterium]|nr:DUF2927 domain-containing protein [Hyphomicrobiales bacterium]
MEFSLREIASRAARRWALPVLVPVFLAACQTAPASLDLPTRFFNDVAFSASRGGHPVTGRALLDPGYPRHALKRWERGIRFGLFGQVPDGHRDFALALVRRLGELAGRPVTVVDDRAAANFAVSFDPGDGFLINQAEFTACYTQIVPLGPEIADVAIHISAEQPDKTRRCLTHEMLHGFGLHHTNLLQSSMNYGSPAEEPTRWDELALRAMYSPRLSAGMTRRQALPIARQVIAGILDGTAP